MALHETKFLTFTGPSSSDNSFVVSGIGFTPKAMVLWAGGAIAADTDELDNIFLHGIVDTALTNRGISTGADDGTNSANWRKRITDGCINVQSGTGTILCHASVTAFGSGTVTFDFDISTGKGASLVYNAIFFAGDDVTVEIASTTVAADVVTGVSFQPEFVIVQSHAASGTASFSNRQSTTGVFNDKIEQLHWTYWGGAGTGDTHVKEGIISDEGVARELRGVTAWIVDIQTITSDGFTWTPESSGDAIDFLCFNLNGLDTSIIVQQKPTGAAPQSMNLAFSFNKPLVYLVMSTDSIVLDHSGDNFGCSQTFGAYDPGSDTQSYFYQTDEVDITNRDQRRGAGNILACGEIDVSLDWVATAQTIPPSPSVGPELVFDPNSSKAAYIGAWAWEDVSTGGPTADEVFMMSIF